MNLVSQVLLASWVKNLSFPGPGGPSCCSRIVQSTEGRKPTKISGFFSEVKKISTERGFLQSNSKNGQKMLLFCWQVIFDDHGASEILTNWKSEAHQSLSLISSGQHPG